MNNKEKKLIIDFLGELYDIQSDAGCNDWNFPSDWTQEERVNFVREYHEYNGDPEEFDENHLHLGDFCVVSLLREKLKQEIK